MAPFSRPNGRPNQQFDDLIVTQNLLRATLDASRDMIQGFEAVRNGQGQIVDFTWKLNNHASENVYGDVVGKSLLEHQPGVVEEGIFDAFKQVVETGIPQQYEKHYVHEQFDDWFYQSVVKLNDGVATTTTNISSRKQAEQQLRQSQVFLQSVIDSSLDIIQVFKAVRDDTGAILDFVWVMNNQQAIAQNGQVIGKSLLELNPGVVKTGIFEHMVQVAQTGVAYEHEQHYQHEQFDGWFYQALVKTDDGVTMTTRNISPQKLAEQEVLQLKDEIAQQLTDKYQVLFNSIDQGFNIIELIFDDNGHVIDYWQREHNPVFTQMTGLADAVGKRMSELVPNLEPKWYQMIERIYYTGEPIRVEYPVAALGQWYTAHMSRIGDAGSPFIACLYDDITERKQQEQEQAFLVTLGDTIRPLTDSVTIEGEVTRLLRAHFDAGWCYYVQWDEVTKIGIVHRDAAGKGLASLAGEHDVSDVPGFLELLKANPLLNVSDYEGYELLTPELRDRYTSLGFRSMLMATLVKQERLVASLLIGDDKTRPWSTHEQALLMQVAERTWAAVERAKAEEALRQADRRKDEFLAMLAHELRNPMSTLRSGLQILTLTNTQDEASRKTVEMMNRQMDHLVRMVDDLLDVSRISRGKIELERGRVNLVDLVRHAQQSIATQFEQHGKALHIHLPSTPIQLEGDATRLTQVVANLLTNGLRYTGEQGQVWVSLSHQGKEAILQVRDNGIGLAKDQLSAIFELFVQVDNSTARSKGGLGLGLTLVKRLVEMHGGRVEAQSEGISRGSIFTVYLPTLATTIESDSTKNPAIADPAAAQRILVIDDNADAAMTLGMLLKLKGYDAHTRTSGYSGIEAAENLHPKAILLDIGMPVLDGYATCKLIREQAWGQDMVVIALTGYGQEEDRERTRVAGFDGHLVKPVDLKALTKMLTDLLGKDRSSAGLV